MHLLAYHSKETLLQQEWIQIFGFMVILILLQLISCLEQWKDPGLLNLCMLLCKTFTEDFNADSCYPAMLSLSRSIIDLRKILSNLSSCSLILAFQLLYMKLYSAHVNGVKESSYGGSSVDICKGSLCLISVI